MGWTGLLVVVDEKGDAGCLRLTKVSLPGSTCAEGIVRGLEEVFQPIRDRNDDRNSGQRN